MIGEMAFVGEFFFAAALADEKIARQVAAARCRFCGGPLHRGDFDRKVRGGLLALGIGPVVRRISLCCGRQGCRKRSTPPSLRFAGRRVYAAVVMLLASVLMQVAESPKKSEAITGVPSRTVQRWLRWWQGAFLHTAVLIELRARLVGVEEGKLPLSLMERVGSHWSEQVWRMLLWLSPLSTKSVPDGARFLRDLV